MNRNVPLRRAQGKRKKPKDTGPSRKVRALVLDRDNYRCVSCGCLVGIALSWWSLQHRKARGQGGDNSPQNLVVLCGSATSAGCHRQCEDRDREMQAKGYWLESWQDPAAEPVMIFSGGGSGITAWLTEDGGYSFEPPEAGAA